jgi:hypothetical protein
MTVGSQNSGYNRPGQPSVEQASGGSTPEEWDAIKEDVGHMAGAAVERGWHFLDSAREQATNYVDRRKDDAAQSVADLAQSLRDACKQFEERPNITAFVESAAGGLDELAETIRERSFNEIFGDVEEVVRRRPAAVAAASVVAGFLVARFIKSSAEGIRQAEMNRRRGNGSQQNAQGRNKSGQRSRAQASPGSSRAQV